ncbi:MAG: AI-2E family transporter [Bacteroidetes bacterium]|nr:AI-2E family transporter [Bacteroidota bacterium]
MENKNENPFKLLNFTAVVLLSGFTVFILKELQSIFLPLFVAVIITFVFLPLYNFLNSKKIPAVISMIIIILIIFILANTVSVFILTSINSISQEFPKYEEKFIHYYESLLPKLNLNEDQINRIKNFFDVKNLLMDGSLTGTITNVLSNITSLLGSLFLIIFYVIFLITESESMGKRFTIAYSEEKNASFRVTLSHIIEGLRDYISGKTLLSLIQAIVIGVILWISGVEFYLIWAFLFFLTDYIPNIGSLLASILVGLFMILQFESILFPVIIMVILVLIQNIKGNVIEPKFIGAKLDLSPFLLFFSLVFWGYIWGIIGMILSVPIMSMLKIILMNIPATKSIAILMSNNPEKINN